jgi:hypothetical protein
MLRWDFQASFCRCKPGVGGRDVKLTCGRRRRSMEGGVEGICKVTGIATGSRKRRLDQLMTSTSM